MLTDREREVLFRIIAGQRTKEIAYAFGTADATVRVLLGRIMKKLGVSTRQELIRKASQPDFNERSEEE